MARYSGKKQVSEETRTEAARIARGTQSPGQSKAQTKLIAQGIARGIDLYKKEQKEKSRVLQRRQRARSQSGDDGEAAVGSEDVEIDADPPSRQHWLPWVLLLLTWAAIGAYWVMRAG